METSHSLRSVSLGNVLASVLLQVSPRQVLHWLTEHTGIPIAVVAAAVIVLSWRFAKKALRLVVQIALVAVVLVVATRFGWIHW